MNRHIFLLSATMAMCVALAGIAHAQEAGSRGSREGNEKKPVVVKPVTPSIKAPPLPTVEKTATATTVQASTFPALPPSRPCVAEEMRGLFKLVAVYEDPPGEETSAFKISPHQYLMFRNNSTFMKANMGTESLSTAEVMEQMQAHSAGLTQFLLQENGFLYFYLDSVAVDVKACFIVMGNKAPFKNDQMILMPPKGQIQGRLAKIYDRLKAEEKEKLPVSASTKVRSAKGKKKKKK